MSFYYVSDLHIRSAEDPMYRSLLALLRDRVRSGDTVVLGGDIFDLFIGDKPVFMRRYAEFFLEAARAIERGARVHYIEGNHDFMMKRAFEGLSPVPLELHPQDMSLEISGKRFFIAHGDLADRQDYGYRALRGFFRSAPLRAFVRVAPGGWIDWIGRTSSRYSREARPALPSSGLDALRKIYRSFAAEKLAQGYDFVVMGHCHDLDEMSFVVGGRAGQYINVGFPPVHGSFLVWSPGDEKISREPLP